MLLYRSLISAGTLAIATLSVVPASAAVTTFANYSATTTDSNLYWKKVGVSGGEIFTTSSANATTVGGSAVNYSFLQPSLLALGPLQAVFTLAGYTSQGNPAASAAGFLIQPVVTGSFSFIYTGLANLVVGGTTYHTGANLLSATFSNAGIVGASGATSGSLSASTASDEPKPEITYTSDFLNFAGTNNQDFAFSLTSITAALKRAGVGQSLNSFHANSSGAFSTDPAPVVSAVPEPSVWATMIIGFSLVGLQVRKRKSAATTA